MKTYTSERSGWSNVTYFRFDNSSIVWSVLTAERRLVVAGVPHLAEHRGSPTDNTTLANGKARVCRRQRRQEQKHFTFQLPPQIAFLSRIGSLTHTPLDKINTRLPSSTARLLRLDSKWFLLLNPLTSAILDYWNLTWLTSKELLSSLHAAPRLPQLGQLHKHAR